MWTNNPSAAPSTSSAAALTIQTGSSSDNSTVRLLLDNELRDLESDFGLRTPNGIIVRHFDSSGSGSGARSSTTGSFRRPKPHRRDSWEEGTVRLHNVKHPHVPKWRETGRNKFGPISSHTFRHWPPVNIGRFHLRERFRRDSPAPP